MSTDEYDERFEKDGAKQTVYQRQPATNGFSDRFVRFSEKLDALGVELRGIHRVEPDERRSGNLREVINMYLLWMSGCGGLSSVSGYLLGPLLFQLSFKDCISSGVAGTVVGCAIAAYGATMGPRSGLRQMVGVRYQFGWWPAKFIALLNIVTLLGWSVVNCVFGGQILSAVSNNAVPIEVGITIITVIAFSVAIVGIRYIQYAEGFAAIPIIFTFLLLYIVSGKHFDLTTPSAGDSQTIIGNWLSNFSSVVGITGTWIAITSDYYVEFPESTPRMKTFLITFSAIFLPTMFVGILAIGVASGAYQLPAWQAAWDNLGAGGLLTEAFSPWHAGGKFLVVVLYISLVTNNILNSYSLALSMQVWGRMVTKIPRYILVVVSAMIFFVLAMAGRNKLSNILSTFLPMISYWCVIYVAILLEENFLFRRHNIPGLNDAYDWTIWNEKEKLPDCIAACLSFVIGVVGAVLGMNQGYYVGVFARKVGDMGADIGLFIAFGFTMVSYPVLRYIELRYAPKVRFLKARTSW
ncbi:Tpn1p [Sugiyamaella lignohabitans]|uniref:Tpn1p n=1 Tax=Sugiyamaella lignohabitans TaxID=796027 RepID=A0A167CCU9_9ASCO|nr:Tpn1p [Sugiyamaella lignohabitans]ANB11520.1 Tpn1p [Sugiyamaella lignohabitans]